MFPCGPGFFGGATPPATDPYWSQVQSLLHFDGAGSSMVFTDTKGLRTWTSVGGAALSTAQVKFGSASGNFGASNSYIYSSSATGMSPGASDFAIEFWWQPRSAAAAIYRTIMAGSGSGDIVLQTASPSSNALIFYGNGAFTDLSESSSATSDVWHFYKLARNGTALSMTRDGTVTATATIASGKSFTMTGSLLIGCGPAGGSVYGMDSWMDDFRVTVGTSRPGSVVPTAAFPNM